MPSAVPARFKHGIGEFFATGGLTPILFLLSWVLRRSFGLDVAEYAVGFLMFHAAFVINDPHFAVTYVLFYANARERALGGAFAPAQRARYVVAGLVVPLALGAWAVTALATRSAPLLGSLIQLMFLLVGWHYVKQGFGVMTVLAARRGVRFGALERVAILAHCYAGWAYAWASPADPGTEVEEKGVVFTTIARSHALERATLVACVLTALVLAAVLVRKRVREGRLPIATPLVALLCSIWPWSIYSSVDPLVVYAVPALHSVQYLYFVSVLKRNEAREREGPPSFEMSAGARVAILAASAIALGVVLFHAGPSLLDAIFAPRHSGATALGPTPFFAAIYAFVNIHHYAMDAVIWRRENPLTRYLFTRDAARVDDAAVTEPLRTLAPARAVSADAPDL
jgi:hypothetical protein